MEQELEILKQLVMSNGLRHVSNRPWQICSCLRAYPLFQYFQVFKVVNVLFLVFSEI